MREVSLRTRRNRVARWSDTARATIAAFGALVSTIVPAPSRADTYTVTLEESAREQSATGRIILFFIMDGASLWPGASPVEGPFFEDPQPIASVAVADLKPGGTVTIDGGSPAFPCPLNGLTGKARVQAVLDVDETARSFLEGPGNVVSDVVSVDLDPARDDAVSIMLSHPIEGRVLPPREPNLHWVEYRSESLSGFAGRDIFHRAGVCLPNGYDDADKADDRWPVVYVIPGFGGREESAVNYAVMLREVAAEFVPQAVFIVLDPDAPLGHHGFVDSSSNGPRSTAFVREFIPHLESRFRLAKREEGRLLYGHSSGGWAALWLQLNWPDVFGGCWSSAPDPVDFTAFQMTNLTRDTNLYEYAPGQPTPSYRSTDFEGRDIVHMTVREECGMERAISPDGRSGQQWDAWEAMFSPRDETTGLPKPICDPQTGAINREVAARWHACDIARLVHERWDALGPVMQTKVRLFCGEFDSFYLNRAVARLKEQVELRAGEGRWTGPGYVRTVPFANHGTVVHLTTDRMNREMIEHFRLHGW